MSEEVKASFYLRFSDVLGEDPATAMQKIVDGGIKIDSDFVETLQKQKKDAEEALKAAKLLAKVSGDSFVDAGLDISMKEEYEKAKKILDSTEQMWDSLKTDDVSPERTRGQAASPATPRSESLEQQIMRETLGSSSNESAQARPPAGGNSAGMPMNLYDQMDALLGSISDGSFSSPSTPAPTAPSSASGAKPPPLRAPKRPQQLQDQQERPEQPAHAAPGPPPALAGRPALGAASARAAADEEDLSAAELERRAVELEEELFQGGAGDGLAEAEAVSMARERIQALRTGDADVGGGSGMSGGSLEDRFPDLADSDGVTMEALLNQTTEPRREEKPAAPQPPPQPPKALAARPKVRPPPPPEPQESGPEAVQSEPQAAPPDVAAAAPAAIDPQRAAKPAPPAASGQPPRPKPVAAAPPPKQALKQPQPDAAAAPRARAVPAVAAEAPEPGAQQAAAPAARPAAPLPQARSDGGGSAAAMEDAMQRALTEPDKAPPRRRVPVTSLPQKRRKARRTPAQQAEAVEQLAPPPPTSARRARGAGFVPTQQRPNAAAADGAAVGAGVEGAPDASGTGEAEAAQQAAQPEAVPLIDRPTKPAKRAEKAEQQSPEEVRSAPVRAPPGAPFYAMITGVAAQHAIVRFGDNETGVLPLELMSRHTAQLVRAAQGEQQEAPQRGQHAVQGRPGQLTQLIRAVLTGESRNGVPRVSERAAYTFADVGSWQVSAATDPLVAEALLAGEADVATATEGRRDAGGGYPVHFRPSQQAVGIAQALLDSGGLPEVEGYAVDDRLGRSVWELPPQTRVRARVCRGRLERCAIRLTILSTEHDALTDKLSYAGAVTPLGELPRGTLRCLSALADMDEVAGIDIKRVVNSPDRVAQPKLYVSKEEKRAEKDDGTAGSTVVVRDIAVHCRRVVVACAVRSTLARQDFAATLNAIADAV